MTNAELIQKIRTEIERLMDEYKPIVGGVDETTGAHIVLANLLSFLDTLEEERPEPYNPVYDEAYLNEKIAKATKSWKGVDVDAMLDECRGREKSEKPNLDLEKEIDSCWQSWLSPSNQSSVEGVLPKTEFSMYARHFAQWGAEHAREQMMKEAVDTTVHLEPGAIPIVTIGVGRFGLKVRDKVRVFICKKED